MALIEVANAAGVAEKAVVKAVAGVEPAEALVAEAEVFYVSLRGNNQGGRSWENAWNELSEIQWNQIGPGDTILIDGGLERMIYRTSISIGQSGKSGEPIRLQRATTPGRNGKVVLFGGRNNRLPYCDQKEYQDGSEDILEYGIRTNNHKWLFIDGLDWQGMAIHGFERSGIRIDRESEYVTVRHMEIFDNGEARENGRGWEPNGFGIQVGGINMLVERAIIYDNGQDAIQSLGKDNNLRNLRINQSWFHNRRNHPSVVNESFNYCAHADGLQIYAGGLVQQLTVENSILGPGLTNALMLGQTKVGNGIQADLQDVRLSNTLITKPADNGIFGYEGTNTRNWEITDVTIHCPKTKWHCLTIDNRQHEVRNSIVVGSQITFKHGLNLQSNNCIWNTRGFELGKVANPKFVDVSDNAPFSLDDYSLQGNSPCVGRGSSITSVEKLLGYKPQLYSEADTSPVTPPGTAVIPPVTRPEVNPTIVLAATAGELFEPYQAESDAVFQNVDTKGPTEGGLARYQFQITRDGYYQVEALVNAEDTGRNSLFLNMNGDATGDYMIWDIPLTSGYEKQIASWRGNGDHNQNEFSPKLFYLRSGHHTLFIRGREAFTYLSQLQLEWVSDETPPEQPTPEPPTPEPPTPELPVPDKPAPDNGSDTSLLPQKLYIPFSSNW
ncbi:MAG: hypothetical protein AAF702_30675 [Chloroflexota bacterium]